MKTRRIPNIPLSVFLFHLPDKRNKYTGMIEYWNCQNDGKKIKETHSRHTTLLFNGILNYRSCGDKQEIQLSKHRPVAIFRDEWGPIFFSCAVYLAIFQLKREIVLSTANPSVHTMCTHNGYYQLSCAIHEPVRLHLDLYHAGFSRDQTEQYRLESDLSNSRGVSRSIPYIVIWRRWIYVDYRTSVGIVSYQEIKSAVCHRSQLFQRLLRCINRVGHANCFIPSR